MSVFRLHFLTLPKHERLRIVRELQDLLDAPQTPPSPACYLINEGAEVFTLQGLKEAGLDEESIARCRLLAINENWQHSNPIRIRRIS